MAKYEHTCCLVDNHAHLQDVAFLYDLDQVMKASQKSGVGFVACNGTQPSDWEAVEKIAKHHFNILPSYGLHPWYVENQPEDWPEILLQKLSGTPSGVGEIGLDRWIKNRNEKLQEKAFRIQLQLAVQLKKPVTIHCLRAWEWLLDILRSEPVGNCRMIIHAYGGSAETVKPLADLDCYFSFAANILDKKRIKNRRALAAVPLERLLLETDSPDFPPPGLDRKTRNEPGNLSLILAGAAKILELPEEELVQILWRNSVNFWGDILTVKQGICSDE